MKLIVITSLALLSSLAHALPHLDLEMTSDEYRAHLKEELKKNKRQEIPEPEIVASLKLGDRLSKWITAINASRSASAAIRLTSVQTRRGIPIETPSIYSPSIIGAQAKKIIADLPENMRTVLTTNVDFPTSLGMEDAKFIEHARLVDRNYQSAARYRSVDLYRAAYAHRAIFDVRGYYYLTKNKITAASLSEVSRIPTAKLPEIKEALAKVCFNTNRDDYVDCKNYVETAVKNNTLSALYSKYIARSKEIWDDFFVIPRDGRRSDINWVGNVMTVPFNTPSIQRFIPYLKDNIEDEFRFKEWKLKMNFGTFPYGPELIFQAGVVPHVNGLGGNEIVMDSNQPIEEYESQWTIRHEFGHVLGLPDCYYEFYDANLKAYVNYQLDVTDLMCSRAGNMNERIYNELKKAYGTK